MTDQTSAPVIEYCPNCQHDDPISGVIHMSDGDTSAWQGFHCPSCQAGWVNNYKVTFTLTGVTDKFGFYDQDEEEL